MPPSLHKADDMNEGGNTMKRSISLVLAAAVALVAGGTVLAQPSVQHNYTSSDIKQMMRDAHTPDQYREISTYFKERQQHFEQQAQSEKLEWERRSQNVTGPAAKYPRPVDSSRNRYEYFSYMAQQMALQVQRFDSLAAKSE